MSTFFAVDLSNYLSTLVYSWLPLPLSKFKQRMLLFPYEPIDTYDGEEGNTILFIILPLTRQKR